MIDVCSEKHSKPINAVCEQNTEFQILKEGGTYSCQ
jgi:hypothetical protein